MRKTYEEYLDKVAKEYGVDPEQMRAIVNQESTWDQSRVSPKGAIGLTQLMPGTAKDLGVDPTDPFQNMQGGVRYYKQLLDRYKGDDVKARAAYNWGMGNLEKYGLENAPAETKKYLTKTDVWPTPEGKLAKEEWPTPVATLAKEGEDKWPEPVGKLEGGESPPFNRVVGQATADLLGATASGLSALGGGLMDYLPGNWQKEADAIRAWGDKQQEEFSTYNLTPEERERVGGVKQVAAELLGKGPLVAGQVMAGAIPAAGLGAVQGASMALEYLKRGGSIEAAQKIFGVQTVANILEMLLPASKVGKGALEVGKGMVVGGPVAGAAADAASRYLSETEELGKLFPDWNDPVARATDLALAGAGALGAKAVQKQPSVDLPPEKKPPEAPDYTDQTALPSAQGGDPRLGRFQANKEAGEKMWGDPRFEVDENGMMINRELSDRIAQETERAVTDADIMAKANAMGIGYDDALQLMRNGYVEDPKVLGAPPDTSPFRFRSAGFRNSFTGEIHESGPIHNQKNLPEAAQKLPAGVLEAGFIGEDGNFYTRQEATNLIRRQENNQLTSNITGGELHSSNMKLEDGPVTIKARDGKPLIELPRETTVSEMAARIAYDFDLFAKKTKRPAAKDPSNRLLDLIFEKVFQKVSDVKVKFDETIKAGHYDPDTHEISINPKKYNDLFDLKRVLAHESIHALLSREMIASPNGRYGKAVKQLMNITDAAFARMAEKEGIIWQGMHGDKYKYGFYAFKNEHEFIAELSQPDMHLALQSVKLTPAEQRAFYKALYGKNMPPSASGMFKNAWQAVTRMVGELFGIRPHEYTALEAMMEVVGAKSDNPKDGNWKWRFFKSGLIPSLDAPPTKFTKTSEEAGAQNYWLDRRSWEDFKQDVPRPTKDAVGISIGAGLTTSSWRIDKQKSSKAVRQDPAFSTVSWGFDQLQRISNEKNARWVDASPLFKELRDRLRPGRALGEIGVWKKMNMEMMRVARELESDPYSWFNGKDYYPDTAELAKRGLNGHQIATYQIFTKIADLEWKMMQAYSKITGRELPTKVPGYIPHFWNGMYKVVLKNKDGTVSHVFRFKSKPEAKRILPTIKELANQHGLSFEFKNDEIIHQPDFNDRSMGELLNAYQEMASVLKNSKGGHDKLWSKIAQAVDAKQREAITNEQFERLPRPVRGHEMDLFANGNLKDISNKDVIEGLTDRFVRVNDLLASAEAIHEVWKPIERDGYLTNNTTPEAFRVFDDMLMQFLGINRNAFSSIDAALERGFAKVGADPKAGKALGSYINGLASVFYLSSTKFLHATFVQPTEMLHQMQLLDSYLREVGHPAAGKGNVFESMIRTMGRGLHPQNLLDGLHSLFDIPNLSKIKDKGIREAIRRGAISPSMMESLFPNKGIFKLMLPAKKLEMAGRLFTYLVTRDYLESKGFTGQKATDAAVSIVNKTMVPYDPTLGRPPKFEQFGIVGNIFQTFMTYSAHKIGSLNTQLMAIKRYEDPKAKAKAAQALLTGIGLQAALAGVAGVPFVSNIDWIIETINEVFGTSYDTVKMATLKLFNKENIPDDNVRKVLETMAVFGSYNYAWQGAEGVARSGINAAAEGLGIEAQMSPAPLASLTGSMTGVSLMAPLAVPEMALNLVSLAYLGTEEMRKGRPASREEWKKATHNMPWFIKTPAEYALKNKNIKDAYRQFMYDEVKNNPDVVTNNKNLPSDLGYVRTDEDRAAIRANLGSAKSVQEEKVLMVVRNILKKTRKEEMEGAEFLQLFKEDMLYNSLTPKQKVMVLEELVKHYKQNTPSAVKEYFKSNVPYNRFPQKFKTKPNLYERYLEEYGELEE